MCLLVRSSTEHCSKDFAALIILVLSMSFYFTCKHFSKYIVVATLNRFIQKQNVAISNNDKNKPSTENKSPEDSIDERIMIDVPFVGKATQQLRKDVTKLVRKIKLNAQVIAVPRSPKAVQDFFKNKDETLKDLQSNIIYEMEYNDCSAIYIRKTRRQAYRRLKEHGTPIGLPPIETNQSMTIRLNRLK